MNVFDLYAKISLDTKGYEKDLDGARSSFSKFGDGLKSAAGKLGDVLAHPLEEVPHFLRLSITRLILPSLRGSVPGATRVILGESPTISLIDAATCFLIASMPEMVSVNALATTSTLISKRSMVSVDESSIM